MDYGQLTERLMGMSDETWKRHANPWSGWTRFAAMPLLTAAIWSRLWLGWGALAPLALVVIFIWINPRMFPAPKTTGHWMSRGVLGERVWLNRKNIPIPDRYEWQAQILNLCAGIGLIPYAYGLWRLEVVPTVLGMVLIIGFKTWFLARMVSLYDEMKDKDPQYASWFY